MRTNVEIDDKLMADAMNLTGLKTKKKIIEVALRDLIRKKHFIELAALKGSNIWQGDLEEMRLNKSF